MRGEGRIEGENKWEEEDRGEEGGREARKKERDAAGLKSEQRADGYGVSRSMASLLICNQDERN